ncbi:MAG TPA: DUF1249 domain-containing protein [Arenimonas sp.]|nr:DUF1249 domain-containing protein [Arenimonas sp.]HMB56972.1 DUF1249 domain-containing protein [Arenimonas sp.]
MSRPSLPRFSRFAWLMGLYGENYQRLQQLFDFPQLQPGAYVSQVPGGLDLLVEVLEVHPYTLELRLSYRLLDAQTGQPDPSAYVRIYRDARQAEVTHCYVGRHWQDVLGWHPSAKVLFGHRLRMNSFLNKWLEYLVGQGHAPQTLKPLAPEAESEASVVCA